MAQSSELLPKGVEDGMVVVQGTVASKERLTEMEDPFLRGASPVATTPIAAVIRRGVASAAGSSPAAVGQPCRTGPGGLSGPL
jgi:hypothetical protein